METITLRYPVHSLDNRELLPAGGELSEAVLTELTARNCRQSFQTFPLLTYGSVQADLLHQFNRPPYNTIFSGQRKIDDIMMVAGKISLPSPILQSLDYFKKHDYHTYCHTLMVFALSTLIARDLTEDSGEWIRQISAGPTHDIGKISVPLDILKKTTPLTSTDRRRLEHHTTAGYILLSYYFGDHNHPAALVARDHHERTDGSGWPQGALLSNKLVEIVIICDVYDALISPRPYRNACYDNRTALEEITKMAEGGKVSWDVVRALVAHNRKSNRSASATNVSIEKRGIPPQDNFYGIRAEEADTRY
ncbi:MAG: hypothetical protein C0402_16435 [Thermodesulfovibrio sp.]|nr:hypothetical protein [Thermodesulfovibrio sp.]